MHRWNCSQLFEVKVECAAAMRKGRRTKQKVLKQQPPAAGKQPVAQCKEQPPPPPPEPLLGSVRLFHQCAHLMSGISSTGQRMKHWPGQCKGERRNIYWGGLTRITVRKYTSFGVHPVGKHLGNGPGMLPNINCLSFYMGIQHFGYASVMLQSTSC